MFIQMEMFVGWKSNVYWMLHGNVCMKMFTWKCRLYGKVCTDGNVYMEMFYWMEMFIGWKCLGEGKVCLLEGNVYMD